MHTLLIVAFAMIGGLALSRAVKKIHLPNVTGYLVAGLLIGPCVFKLVPQEALSGLAIVTQAALGFIAFSIGGEFKLASLKAIGKSCVIITFFQALTATFLVDAVLIACGFPLPMCLALGAIATATAPAATLMVVRQYRAKGELTNTLLPVVAIDDAIGLVVFSVSIAMAKALASGQAASMRSMVLEPLLEIVLSLVIGCAIGFFSSLVLRFFHSKGNRLGVTIAAVLLGVGLAKQFGLSDLLLCMAIGATLVNLREDAFELLDITDSWTPPLFMLFFVISGANLDLNALKTVGMVGVVYILTRSVGKYFGAFLGATVVHASDKIRKYLGITLLPQAGVAIGMAQIVLVELPQYGASIQAVVLCATLIYELVGPVLTKLSLEKAGEIPAHS